jgi:hypothetical protein
MSDRLAETKAWVAKQAKYAICQMPQDDAEWLVAEVERERIENTHLREAFVTMEQAYNRATTDRDISMRKRAVLERELAEARQRIYDDNAVCLCGCPPEAHEICDEDGGESCANDEHTCIRVCNAAAQEFAALRQRHAAEVEKAYHEAYCDAFLRALSLEPDEDMITAAWLASDAKKGLI